MSNLAYGRVILKFNSSVLVPENSSSLYSNFILNLHTVGFLRVSKRFKKDIVSEAQLTIFQLIKKIYLIFMNI